MQRLTLLGLLGAGAMALASFSGAQQGAFNPMPEAAGPGPGVQAPAPAAEPRPALPPVISAAPLPIRKIDPIVPPVRRVAPSKGLPAMATKAEPTAPATPTAGGGALATGVQAVTTRKLAANAVKGAPTLSGRQSLGATLPARAKAAAKTGVRSAIRAATPRNKRG
jgi:hypothetical protein